MSEPLFDLGRLVITKLAFETLSQRDIHSALTRHARGDWGDLCKADVKENLFSIDRRLRILSKYQSEGGEDFYCITEADRSSTCILLVDEY